MKRIIIFIIFLIVTVTGLYFASKNAEPVQLYYFFGASELPLALVVIVALLLGALLGVAASFGMMLKTRRELMRLRKAVNLTKKEINNLRAIPLKEKQ